MKKTFRLIGLGPFAIDYSAPGTPAGASPERLTAIVENTRKQFADLGHRCDLCIVRPEASPEAPVTAQLSRLTYDCILIGGGLRQPASLPLLERIINSIHRHAPDAAIGFVDLPTDALKTAARVLSQDSCTPDCFRHRLC